MAGASNRIEITVDDAELQAALKQLADRIDNLQPFFDDIGETLLNSTRERFRSQTSPEGVPWAALSPAYLKHKPRNADKILTLWGRLRGTLVKQTNARELRIGTPLIYGATHQFGARQGTFGRTRRGAPIPWGDIPARPFLGLSAEDRTAILEALAEYMT